MKKATLITTPLLLSVAGLAAAQDSGIHPFSIRGGYSYLANKDSRDATQTGGWTAGASYELQGKMVGGMGAGNNSKISLDVDWDSHRGNGNTLESGSLQIVVRSSMESKGMGKSANSFYVGAGIGAFRNRVSVTDNSVSPAAVTSDTKTVFGGSVLVGMNLASNAFIEVSYRLSGTVDGVRFDTINAAIGMHF